MTRPKKTSTGSLIFNNCCGADAPGGEPASRGRFQTEGDPKLCAGRGVPHQGFFRPHRLALATSPVGEYCLTIVGVHAVRMPSPLAATK